MTPAAHIEHFRSQREVNMTAYQLQGRDLPSRNRAREAKEFRLMCTAVFPLFLVAEVITRGMFWRRGSLGRKSVFAAARTAVNTYLPFAFMR